MHVRGVIVALARPHVRMAEGRIEAVAVALILRPEHGFLQFVHIQRVIGLRGDDLLLEQEAGIDIHHRLRLLDEAGIQQRQFFLRRGVLEKLRDEERLVEGGGGFGQRHRRVVHHQRLVAQHAVVERMPQLVRQRAHVGGAAREVGHHAADVLLVITGAERAAALALARVHVDPALVKRGAHHVAHLRAEAAEQVEQQRARLLDGVGAAGMADRGEEIVERQAVLVAEQAALRLEILAQFRQRLADGRPHRVERLFIHAEVGERHIQHALVAAQLRHGFALGLDAVEAVAHRDFELLVRGQLGVVGLAAHVGVRVVGHRAGGGKRNRLAVVIDRQRRVQLVAKLGERLPAGKLHLHHRLFEGFRKLMLGVFGHLQQREGAGGERFVRMNQLAQVLQLGEIATQRVVRLLHQHGGAHQRRHRGVGGLVLGVHGKRQLDHQHQALKGHAQRFDLADQRGQLGGLVLARRGDGLGQRGDGRIQPAQIRLKRRIVKILVKNGQIPIRLHGVPPFSLRASSPVFLPVPPL